MDIAPLLDQTELYQIVVVNLRDLAASSETLVQTHDTTVDDLGNEIGHAPLDLGPGVLAKAMVPFWSRLKEELHTLVCTDDPKYSDVRQKLVKAGKQPQILLVTTITAAVAPFLGIAAGALVTLCAALLYALARMGVSAFCAGHPLDTKIS